jgi:uncharacterized protein (UPF0332 family)
VSFNWTDYLTLAENLVRDPSSPGPKEASLRAAISRAYYGAFCSARSFAETKDNPPLSRKGKASDHRLIIDHFAKFPDPDRKKISVNLDRLRSDRNKADYDDHLHQSNSLATISIQRAQEIIKSLQSLGL